ncbi:MAG: serine/threonine-protein phosphatase, partial [Lachnospiraceae bacterium]|nr:serine/threonine-protein phosphatase [Lachnospiraceae bacterium]
MAYSCESLGDNHFIFDGKYIIYYQLDNNTIKYDILDNLKENYNLSIGSLYDYDNNSYVYDEHLFDNYVTHSGEELFSNKDYSELEKELKEISKQQEKNGYSVEELNIVYISPENIEAYLASNEEETFFGYSVDELENSLGIVIADVSGKGVPAALFMMIAKTVVQNFAKLG